MEIVLQALEKNQAKSKKKCQLIVLNDDFNTFEHVIKTLIAVCQLTQQQAEQASLIIHYKGKVVVREGEQYEMLKMKYKICERRIGARVKELS